MVYPQGVQGPSWATLQQYMPTSPPNPDMGDYTHTAVVPGIGNVSFVWQGNRWQPKITAGGNGQETWLSPGPNGEVQGIPQASGDSSLWGAVKALLPAAAVAAPAVFGAFGPSMAGGTAISPTSSMASSITGMSPEMASQLAANYGGASLAPGVVTAQGALNAASGNAIGASMAPWMNAGGGALTASSWLPAAAASVANGAVTPMIPAQQAPAPVSDAFVSPNTGVTPVSDAAFNAQTAAGVIGAGTAAAAAKGAVAKISDVPGFSLLPTAVQTMLGGLPLSTAAGLVGALLGATQGQPAPITTTVTPWEPAAVGMQQGLKAVQDQLAKGTAFNAPNIPNAPNYGSAYNAPQITSAPKYTSAYTAPQAPNIGIFGNTYAAPNVTAPTNVSSSYQAPNAPNLQTYGNAYVAPSLQTPDKVYSSYTAPTAPTLQTYGNAYTAPNVTAPTAYDPTYTGEYVQNAIRGAIMPLEDQFQRVTVPTIGTNSMGNGQFGSSRQAIAEALAASDLTRNTGALSSQMIDRMAQEQAANVLATRQMNSSNTTNYNSLLASIAQNIAQGQQTANAQNSSNQLNLYNTQVQSAQSAAADALQAAGINSTNTSNYNSLLASIAAQMATSQQAANTLNSSNQLNVYNTQSQNAQNSAADALNAAGINSTNTANFNSLLQSIAQSISQGQQASNTLNSSNQLNVYSTQSQNAQNASAAAQAANALNSSNLWNFTNANITNAADQATATNAARSMNDANLWANFGAQYKSAQDTYQYPWNALTSANNIFSQAGGVAKTSNTPLPETPWWQTAIAGGGAASTAMQKLFPSA